jgi:hypothetical protein
LAKLLKANEVEKLVFISQNLKFVEEAQGTHTERTDDSSDESAGETE